MALLAALGAGYLVGHLLLVAAVGSLGHVAIVGVAAIVGTGELLLARRMFP
ncbi:MAG: hypothetical protein ACOC2Y_05975 [Spirochaetota bacterium]